MKKVVYIIFLLSLGVLTIHAQTCTENLQQAQRDFDDGLLEDIPGQLTDCMEDGFTREEKVNAYKLLIQTYIFSEDIQNADETMLQFLREFPSYSIAENDPKEFIDIYNTYRTKPIFKIEILFGTTLCKPFVNEYLGSENITASRADYKANFGFNSEVNYIGVINKNFSYSGGVSFSFLSTEYSNTPFEGSLVSGNLTNMYVGLPFGIRYNYSMNYVDIFLKAGVEGVYLLNSLANLTREDPNLGDPIPDRRYFTDAHKKIDTRPFLGMGAELNLGRDQLIITAGYKPSFIRHINEPYYDLSPGNPIEKVYYVEDDTFLNQTIISLSYIRPIYKPKKIN